MVHHLQIIGEAVREISEETRAKRPDVPWKQIVAMRHVLVHRYFVIDPDEVWNSVIRDVPVLRANVESLLAELAQVP